MNISCLKKINESMPDFLKKLIAPFIRSKLIDNRIFLEQYKELCEYSKKNDKEKELIQFDKLKSILIYSYENVRYYKELFDIIDFNPYNMANFDEIKKIPFLTREDVNKKYESLLSSKENNFYSTYTGGSTGKPLKISLSKESIYRELAFVYNYWSSINYDYKTSKLITFRGLDFGKKIYKYNPLYNEMIFSITKLNKKYIQDYLDIIYNFKPQFIKGYPSVIMNFCQILKSKNIEFKLPIEGVFLVSENVTQREKKYIEDFLKCKVISFYGHSERAVFAEEDNLSYNFNNLYGYTELIPTEEQGYYKIVCTGFINKKMPLIRYITGDIAKIKDGKISIIGHRDKEIVIGKDGEKIFLTSINFHSNVFNKFMQFQFEQLEKGKITFNVVVDGKYNDEEVQVTKEYLEKELQGMLDVYVKVVDKIKLTKIGKYKILIQHIKFE